jgi:hypothetical protein
MLSIARRRGTPSMQCARWGARSNAPGGGCPTWKQPCHGPRSAPWTVFSVSRCSLCDDDLSLYEIDSRHLYPRAAPVNDAKHDRRRHPPTPRCAACSRLPPLPPRVRQPRRALHHRRRQAFNKQVSPKRRRRRHAEQSLPCGRLLFNRGCARARRLRVSQGPDGGRGRGWRRGPQQVRASDCSYPPGTRGGECPLDLECGCISTRSTPTPSLGALMLAFSVSPMLTFFPAAMSHSTVDNHPARVAWVNGAAFGKRDAPLSVPAASAQARSCPRG